MYSIITKIIYKILYSINEIKAAKYLGVKIGENCRLLNCTFSTEPYLVKSGNHVSATHTHFETHDGGVWIFRDKHPEWDKIAPITIGNNVYIGEGCIILPGVNIGNNVIIGARSIITKDIPNNSVAVGSPAKVIKNIDDYYNKAKDTVHPTKLLSAKRKKEYYTQMYL